MRIRLLLPPPITVQLDRDYRVEPLWEEVSGSGYLAAYFHRSDHWKLTDAQIATLHTVLSDHGRELPPIPAGCNTVSTELTLRTGERALICVQGGFAPEARDDEREVNGAVLLVLADPAWSAAEPDDVGARPARGCSHDDRRRRFHLGREYRAARTSVRREQCTVDQIRKHELGGPHGGSPGYALPHQQRREIA